MNQPKLSKFNLPLVVACLLVGSLVLTLAFAGPWRIIMGAVNLTTSHAQISAKQANKMCQDFYTDVESQIRAIPDVTVMSGKKLCRPEQDGAGLTDYVMDLDFRVSMPNNNSKAEIKSNISKLSAKLPTKNYSFWIDNLPPKNDQPATICVGTNRDINNDGKDHTLGPSRHYPRYTEPGDTNNFTAGCDL